MEKGKQETRKLGLILEDMGLEINRIRLFLRL
jgi:hypothetical protein